MLVVRLPLPYGSGTVNAVLVPGEEPTVVDPGPNTEPAREALAAACLEAGIAVERLRRVVVTHGHIGHCGLAGWLHARSGADVVCHPAAAGALADFPAEWRSRVGLLRRAAVAGGFPADAVDAMLATQTALGVLGGSVPSAAIRATRDGDRLGLGSAPWSVLHTPGHARDHACFFHGPSGSLIAGDMLLRRAETAAWLEDRRPDGSRPAALDDLIASWRRLSRMPLAIAWPGHGSPIRAPRLLLARRLAGVQTHVEAARRFLERGPATLHDIALGLDMDTSPDVLPTTLSHAVALADHLVARGDATRKVDGGVVRFRGA